jgi:hypothetical protein
MKINNIIIFTLLVLSVGSLEACNQRQTQLEIMGQEMQSLAILYEIGNDVIHLVHLEKEERKEYTDRSQNNGDFFLRAETWSIVKAKSSNYEEYFHVILLLHCIPEKIIDPYTMKEIERYHIESIEEFWAFYHDQQIEHNSSLPKEWGFCGNSDEKERVCVKTLNYYWTHQNEIKIIKDE